MFPQQGMGFPQQGFPPMQQGMMGGMPMQQQTMGQQQQGGGFMEMVGMGDPSAGAAPAGWGGGPDGWTVLASMNEIEIKEKIRWGEVLTEMFVGVEVDFANQYMGQIPGDPAQDVFFFAEQTDFCTRQLKRGSCADCVGWNLDVLNVAGGQKTKFLHMHRDHTCTFLCFNRPIVEIKDEASGQVIGSIQDPFACCDLTFKLMGPDGSDVLIATGGCCQWGLCCPLPCGPCAEVNFDINDAASGEKVGHIQKKVPGCCKFLIDDQVDNYKVDFAAVGNPQWKAMVMVLAVFIDFRYFSETQDPDEIGDSPLSLDLDF